MAEYAVLQLRALRQRCWNTAGSLISLAALARALRMAFNQICREAFEWRRTLLAFGMAQ